MAKRNPAWNFIFVGPTEEGISNVLSNPNIHLFDRVDGERIPAVVNGFDVGIIPYNIDDEMMDYVFPRKACEFLAEGKAVVSTPLAEMKNFGAFATTATTADEFELAIRQVLGEEDASERRKAFVKCFDWEVLLEGIKREFI